MQLRFVFMKITLRIAALEKEINNIIITSLLFILHYIKLTYLASFAQKDVLKVDFYFYTLSTFWS